MKKLVLGITFIAAIALISACSAKKEADSTGAAKAAAVPQDVTKADPAAGNGGSPSQSMAESDGQAYHRITAEEAKSMMDGGGVIVVDVRTENEYKAGHIPGSILVPNETIDQEAAEVLPDKDAVLLIHCRTGVRSKQASDTLVEMGYQNIYDFGGIVDWPYDTVTEQ